jgi:hypothetical protein
LYLNKVIEINNKLPESYFEDNIDFTKYSTKIKPIAIYYSNIYYIKFNYFSINNNFNIFNFFRNIKSNTKSKDYFQKIKEGDKKYLYNYNYAYRELLKRQINLAKSQGVYGFAFYYYWFSGKTIFDIPLRIISKLNINFSFMLIWKNENIINSKKEIVIKEKYNNNYAKKFILDIKKYLLNDKYIRIEGRPVIGLYNPKNIKNLKEIILIWRKTAKKYNIHIYIISAVNEINETKIKILNLFDAGYISPQNDLFKSDLIKNTRENFYYYYGLFYSKMITNDKIRNFTIFKGNIIKWIILLLKQTQYFSLIIRQNYFI